MKSKAIVFAGVRDVEIWDDVEIPPPGPAEVLVRTELTGISVGTDGWMLLGRYPGVQERYPYIYGYQRVGIVEETGSEVCDLKVGDRVFVGTGLSGGTRMARDGRLAGRAGAYTAYGCCTQEGAIKIPEGVASEDAAMTALVAVPMVGRNLTGVAPGDLVVVLGQGMIGQMAAQLCRIRGARVIGVDVLDQRVELSRNYSADIAVNSAAEDLVPIVHQAQEVGADVVFDCTGRSDLFSLCMEIVRGECNEYAKPGRLCMQGFFPDPIPVDFADAHRRRLTMTFPCGFDISGSREALRLMSEGRLEIQGLISHVWDIDQAPEAFSLMLDKPNDVMGMYIRW